MHTYIHVHIQSLSHIRTLKEIGRDRSTEILIDIDREICMFISTDRQTEPQLF